MRGGEEGDLRLLHGEFDGGGLLAVGIAGECVVSAGRDGGARLWRMAPPSPSAGSEELQLLPGGAAGRAGATR